MLEQPFLFGDDWIEVKDGNQTARAIFDRHYSRYKYKNGRESKLFVGPGQKLVLLWPDATALFVWRKFISDNNQSGVNCAVFRNEGAGKSSDLIIAAESIADKRWPNERHYTYVAPTKIKSENPVYCFKMAGWKQCGVTKVRKLIILERLPANENRKQSEAA